MRPGKTEQSYRQSAVEGASPIGLMIILFDRLIADLRRAAAAIRKKDIEGRCKQFDHALLVLGLLQSWLDVERGGESARAIALFYAQIRSVMTNAGSKQSAPILEKQIDVIMDVRNAWQLLDAPPSPSGAFEAEPMASAAASMPGAPRVSFSLSA